MMQSDLFPSNALLVVEAGSRAYGTNTADSDEDYRGIIPATREMLVGLKSWDSQYEHKDPDIVLYTLPKFVKLALGANPNILDALFCDDSSVLKATQPAMELRYMADDWFLSKRVYYTFGGYAHHQLMKIRHPGGQHGAHRERVEKYGFDTKHASHVVRLYRMGYEILTQGIVQVHRPDAEELLAIKHGAWSIEEVEAFAKDMAQKMKVALATTSLPDAPNVERVTEWLMDWQEAMLRAGV